MSLSVAGVWAVDVWDQTVWADGVWREGEPPLDLPTGLWADLEIDVSITISINGESVTWTTSGGPTSVECFWRGAHASDDDGMGPSLTLAESDLPATADYGDTITRNSVDYTVARFLPDGHGVMRILLRH